MHSQVEIIEPRLFAGEVADEIVASIGEIVAERGMCSVVLSGGSTPAAVYRALATPPRVEEVPWDKVLFFWGDERWVSQTDSRSNYKMASETLLSNIPAKNLRIYPIETALPSPSAGASEYAKTIQSLKLPESGGLPVFDLVLLGMGEDGHIASIFPGSKLVDQPDGICQAVVHPQDQSERVTLTPAVLFNAAKIIFIVTGQAKASMLKKIFDGQLELAQAPARLYERAKDRVTWFLDSAAGAHLKH